jgi:hypothetical protein
MVEYAHRYAGINDHDLAQVRETVDDGVIEGHPEKFKVPVPHRPVPPFPSAQALGNAAMRRSHFSLRVLKNRRDGILQDPLKPCAIPEPDQIVRRLRG